jgi:hypothetical protein
MLRNLFRLLFPPKTEADPEGEEAAAKIRTEIKWLYDLGTIDRRW